MQSIRIILSPHSSLSLQQDDKKLGQRRACNSQPCHESLGHVSQGLEVNRSAEELELPEVGETVERYQSAVSRELRTTVRVHQG